MTNQTTWTSFEDETPPLGIKVVVISPNDDSCVVAYRNRDDKYTCFCGKQRVNVRFPVECMWQYLPSGEVKKVETEDNNNGQ